MIISKEQEQRIAKTMESLATIRIGDFVEVVDCFEADFYKGKALKVLSEPRKIGPSWTVKIEKEGYFDISCLKKITAEDGKDDKEEHFYVIARQLGAPLKIVLETNCEDEAIERAALGNYDNMNYPEDIKTTFYVAKRVEI